MYIRDWGFAGQLDLKRPVVKSDEATSDRLNNERLRALPLTLIFKPESVTVTFYLCWPEISVLIWLSFWLYVLSLINCYSFIFTAEFRLFLLRLFIHLNSRNNCLFHISVNPNSVSNSWISLTQLVFPSLCFSNKVKTENRWVQIDWGINNTRLPNKWHHGAVIAGLFTFQRFCCEASWLLDRIVRHLNCTSAPSILLVLLEPHWINVSKDSRSTIVSCT